MGEYYIVCNLDKKEVLDPSMFDDGNKLGDFQWSIEHGSKGVLRGLMYLLALSGSVGGTALRSTDRMFGRWAGDRVAIVGDYYQGIVGNISWDEDTHDRARSWQDGWVDISEHVVRSIDGSGDDRGTGPRSELHPDGTVTAMGKPWWWVDEGDGPETAVTDTAHDRDKDEGWA